MTTLRKKKTVEEIARELIRLVVAKYPQVQEDNRLNEIAAVHSREMAEKNQACNNDGIEVRYNQIQQTIPGHYYGEIVAGPLKYSNNIAEKVFKMWEAKNAYQQAFAHGVGLYPIQITGIRSN